MLVSTHTKLHVLVVKNPSRDNVSKACGPVAEEQRTLIWKCLDI